MLGNSPDPKKFRTSGTLGGLDLKLVQGKGLFENDVDTKLDFWIVN